MEHLPFVDEHHTRVRATSERTWQAVMQLARGALARPAPTVLAALSGLVPPSGFAIAEEDAPRRLVLRGSHRLSRYELAFDIDSQPDGVRLTARTSARFPGIAGRVYRALVIGSQAHRVIVCRMLERIARSAERQS